MIINGVKREEALLFSPSDDLVQCWAVHMSYWNNKMSKMTTVRMKMIELMLIIILIDHNIMTWLKPPGGGTAIYGPYRYVPL